MKAFSWRAKKQYTHTHTPLFFQQPQPGRPCNSRLLTDNFQPPMWQLHMAFFCFFFFGFRSDNPTHAHTYTHPKRFVSKRLDILTDGIIEYSIARYRIYIVGYRICKRTAQQCKQLRYVAEEATTKHLSKQLEIHKKINKVIHLRHNNI